MNSTKKNILIVFGHIACWLVFLSLPTLFNPRRPELNLSEFIDDLLELPRWRNGLLLIGVFYFNYFVAMPMLFVQRRYFFLFCSLIACFAVFFLVNNNIKPPEFPDHAGDPFPHTMGRPPQGSVHSLGNSFNLFMFIIVYVFSFAMCMYRQLQKAKDQMLTTEISFLKAQINPHFLFNTLNSIYSLALTKSDKTPDAIVKLSGMMRYSVSDANQSFVSLTKELDYIGNYIELQKLRLTDKVKISYTVSGHSEGKQVAPFLLIPFVENAFKHGVNAEEDSDIRINIEITDACIQLSVLNNKVYMRKDIDRGEGLGVSTTRRRLKLLYPGKHTLEVKDTEKEFSVHLKIDF